MIAGVGLPAAGALAAGILRSRRSVLGPLLLLTLVAAAAIALGLPRHLPGVGPPAGLPGPVRALLTAATIELAIVVALAPSGVDRPVLLASGLAGVAGLAALAAAPDPLFFALILLLLGAGHALLPGLSSLPTRLRGPAIAAFLMGLGTLLLRSGAPGAATRVGAMLLAVAVVAAVGVAPFLQDLDPNEPAAASSLAWFGFLGPVLAFAYLNRAITLVPPERLPIFSAVLVGLGLLNLFPALLGAWATPDQTRAWRYSFLADWGLALVGFGILLPDAGRAAYLLMLALLLVRLPLYLFARPVLRHGRPASLGVTNLVAGALLAGVPPFAGFAARTLLLKAAVQLYWPLAAVLALAMLLWMAHAFRLGSTLGRPTGRAAVGVGLALLLGLAIGVYPAPFLAAGGLAP